MGILNRLFGHRETRVLIRCPQCNTDRPNFSVVELSNQWFEGERVVHEVTGYQVSCQNCGSRYSIGPHGVFVPHHLSLPFIPGPEPERKEQPPPGLRTSAAFEREAEEDQRARVLPMPKPRPPFAP